MKKTPFLSGFTLVEVTVSMGIVVIISTLLSLSFIQITRAMKQIETRRQLAQFTANIMSTLSNDMEEYFVKPNNGASSSLSLEQYNGSRSITYTSQTKSDTHHNAYIILTRKENDGQRITGGDFQHNDFMITDLSFSVFPSNNTWDCTTPPAVHIDITAEEKKPLQGTFPLKTHIETTISTGNNPIFYQKYCTSHSSSPTP